MSKKVPKVLPKPALDIWRVEVECPAYGGEAWEEVIEGGGGGRREEKEE